MDVVVLPRGPLMPGAEAGDEAVLIGRRGGEELSAADMARRLGTIGYEILCGIGKRVPRVYIGNEPRTAE